jgi:hypothetical protein
VPKLKLVGLAESCNVTTTPVPLRVTVAGELVALLTTETLPVTLPPLVGANTTVIWALWLGARVCGTVNGPMLNPTPKTPTWESVTLLLPLLVKVMICELLLPTNTLPKLKLVGLAVNWNVAATPVPLRAMAVGEFAALLTSDTLPVTLPAAAGANCTVKVLDCPADRLRGKVSPLRPKPVPVIVACEMVRLALPELLSVTVCVLLLPTSTLPKARLVGLTVKAGCTPLPESVMVAGELVALLTTETLPVTLPATVGAKTTLNVVL